MRFKSSAMIDKHNQVFFRLREVYFNGSLDDQVHMNHLYGLSSNTDGTTSTKESKANAEGKLTRQ